LPALAAAKRQGLRTQCVNNQHEIGLALHMYVDDYREYYPTYFDWATWAGATGTNIGIASDEGGFSLHGGGFNQTNRQLYPYLKNPEICHCARGEVEWMQNGRFRMGSSSSGFSSKDSLKTLLPSSPL